MLHKKFSNNSFYIAVIIAEGNSKCYDRISLWKMDVFTTFNSNYNLLLIFMKTFIIHIRQNTISLCSLLLLRSFKFDFIIYYMNLNHLLVYYKM